VPPITSLDDDMLTLRADNGAIRPLPLSYAAEHTERGYALSGHAAQGTTFERAFVLLPDHGALQEWGYVACSRARTETRLYLTERDGLECETPLRQPTPAAPPERAARALQRPAASRSRSSRRSYNATSQRVCAPDNTNNSNGSVSEP
jgi:ATP-dependent exoDNAse (exonuclease V) alpha subunit